jgi:hypothetical protein
VAADWSPPRSPIKEIENQRRRKTALRDQIPVRRSERDAARARVVELEARDRQSKAADLSAGRSPTSAVAEIAQARSDADAKQRTLEALDLAIADADSKLRETVLKNAGKWSAEAEREKAAAKVDTVSALADMREAWGRYEDARKIGRWLESGLDQPRTPKLGTFGDLAGSQRLTGNRQPVNLLSVFDMLAASLQPEPEPEPEPQTPDQQAVST